ncbi:MAG TPA: hypothetical protein VLV86_00640, partial [Vicinamibacterales bacterium]|nr:hypothetical protein [Vicinamibacterales bacterium]
MTLRRLQEALDAWTELLREVANDVAGASGRDAVRFVITEAKAGSIDLAARPQPARRTVPVAVMPRIAKTITNGLKALERHATRPKHFTDAALLRVRDLGRMTSPETPVVKIGNGAAPIALTSRLVANVEAVLAPEVKSIGTIEGKLQGLITHGKNRFLVFDPLTDRQVVCYFSERIPYVDVIKAFGKRVAVTGMIRARRSGEKVEIQATQLH